MSNLTTGNRTRWPRRRALTIMAAACGAPILGVIGRPEARALPRPFEWRGSALGASARITLLHPDPAAARRLLSRCLAEVRRLESVFSLYDDRSELARLNRQGFLRGASLDLRHLVAESQRLSQLTSGAFDITVQPLWQCYADHFRNNADAAAPPPESELARRRDLVGYRRIDISGSTIGFLQSGMAATLNGIAQGYITDRVADLLRHEGCSQVLVDLGEIAALDAPATAPGWRVQIAHPTRPGESLGDVTLVNRAVASSSGLATRFDASGRHHHLFDPRTGRSAPSPLSVSVVSRRAWLSDALSTALAILPRRAAAPLLRQTGADTAIFVHSNGKAAWIPAT